MLTICICDDRPQEVEKIRSLTEHFVKTHPEQRAQLSAFQSPFALLEHLEQHGGFDLYLLDMLMPHMTGVELAACIRKRGEAAEILFLTTSREYAVEAFGVHAAGYLMKPVAQDAFDRGVLDALSSLSPNENPSLLLKTREGVQKIPLKSIIMIESFNHSRVFTLTDGRKVETPDTLGSLWERLANNPCFFSPHRAYIINLRQISGITGAQVLLSGGARVPVARKALAALKDAYVKCDF